MDQDTSLGSGGGRACPCARLSRGSPAARVRTLPVTRVVTSRKSSCWTLSRPKPASEGADSLWSKQLPPTRGRRIVGVERQTVATDLASRYAHGESIRMLAAATGRSYGFVHRVLSESGVRFRS